MKINEDMIKNILTLRYDPTLKIRQQRFGASDFECTEFSDNFETVEKTIIESISNQLEGEAEVSVALSGGIDSALMTSLLRKAKPDVIINAISIKFADSVDETEIATKIATKFNANHIILPIDNFLEDLPKAISIIKMPFWDTHWYHVVKTAKNFSKSLVSGDGGDELFGGYTFRYNKFLTKASTEMSPLAKTKLYLECHQRDWVPDQDKLFGEKAKFSWQKIYSQVIHNFENSLSPIDQVFLADMNGKLLYNWIPLNSSFHRYFGVKAITPILSTELIRIATHLDNKRKYDQKENLGKIPLRKVLSKYIEKESISPQKQGFSVNTINLWKSHGRNLCDYYLDDARIIEDGWISRSWVENHFKKLDLNPDVRYVNKFLGLLAFEVWYRIFITEEMKEDSTLGL